MTFLFRENVVETNEPSLRFTVHVGKYTALLTTRHFNIVLLFRIPNYYSNDIIYLIC